MVAENDLTHCHIWTHGRAAEANRAGGAGQRTRLALAKAASVPVDVHARGNNGVSQSVFRPFWHPYMQV